MLVLPIMTFVVDNQAGAIDHNRDHQTRRIRLKVGRIISGVDNSFGQDFCGTERRLRYTITN